MKVTLDHIEEVDRIPKKPLQPLQPKDVLSGKVLVIMTPKGKQWKYVVTKAKTKPTYYVHSVTDTHTHYLGIIDPIGGDVLTGETSVFIDSDFLTRLLRQVLACIWEGRQSDYSRAEFVVNFEMEKGR